LPTKGSHTTHELDTTPHLRMLEKVSLLPLSKCGGMYITHIVTLLQWAAYTIIIQVNLQEEVGRGCIFKILPRYKIQSVGQEVQYSDQVKFESVATEGQFLHCSRKTFGDVKIKANKKW
jgi:hypothetical protein